MNIEQEIQAKGLTAAPHVTPADIEANIVAEHYFTGYNAIESDFSHSIYHDDSEFDGDMSLRLLMFCVLVLKNGFTVTGESACVSSENFDVEIGRKIARENAINKTWPLMGYELIQRLHETKAN